MRRMRLGRKTTNGRVFVFLGAEVPLSSVIANRGGGDSMVAPTPRMPTAGGGTAVLGAESNGTSRGG